MIRFDTKIILKVFAPRMVTKAVQAFDRATAVVIAVSWASAVVVLAFALYTLNLSVSEKRAAEQAAAIEPKLPRIIRKGLDPREAQSLQSELQRQFPGLTFSLQSGQHLVVSSGDGGQFREWLSAISYIDTVSPQYHWVLQEFCVGKCGARELMKAELAGERISFAAPAKN